MALSTLIAAAIIGLQGAPSDVPKNHWAFGAVDDLFKNGLLKGYTTEALLQLDPNAKYDDKWMQLKKKHWKAEGYLVGYPDGLWRGRTESRYELAVAVHATFANITSLGRQRDKWETAEDFQARLKEIPRSFEIYLDLARAISMLNPELTKLGADTKEMIAKMNDFRQSFNGQFRG